MCSFQAAPRPIILYLLMDNGMSDTDTMNQADRLKTVGGKSFPNCITVTGCWSFYTPQQSGLNVWTNNWRRQL